MSATPRQADFLRSLLADRTLPGEAQSVEASLAQRLGVSRETAVTEFLANIASPSDASKVIDELKGYPRLGAAPAAPGQPAPTSTEDVPEGIHYLRDGDSITVYKVQVAVHGSGRKYAKVLRPATESWEYVGRGPLASLSESTLLDYETAKEFGALYGVCSACGRTLTDEGSIMLGVGPVCVTKRGWAAAIPAETLKEARRLSREQKKRQADALVA